MCELTKTVNLHSQGVKEAVASIASASSIDYQALLVKVLMHLPRVADESGSVSLFDVQAECLEQAERLIRIQKSIPDLTRREEPGSLQLKYSRFIELDQGTAAIVMESCHFLGSYRSDARYFALVSDPGNRILVCGGLAFLRFPQLADLINRLTGFVSSNFLDVCRLYAFPCAPKNSISHFLAKLHKEVRAQGTVDLLCTVVDPNLGYTGASYRAANWIQIGEVERAPYRYVDGQFVTAGQLRERFGTMSTPALEDMLGDRLSVSICKFQNSYVLGYPITSKARAVFKQSCLIGESALAPGA